MIEKRFDFKYEYITLDEGVFATAKDKQNAELISRTLNQLYEENEQLKSELQKIYEIATINKVRDIVDEVYDDLLYETSDESDYARKNVLKCLEKIDLLRDDLE